MQRSIHCYLVLIIRIKFQLLFHILDIIYIKIGVVFYYILLFVSPSYCFLCSTYVQNLIRQNGNISSSSFFLSFFEKALILCGYLCRWYLKILNMYISLSYLPFYWHSVAIKKAIYVLFNFFLIIYYKIPACYTWAYA